MVITKHIAFYYSDSTKYRINFINRIIDAVADYPYKTDIFIHTNNDSLTSKNFENYSSNRLYVIHHNLSNIHPFKLTWKCRELLSKQKNDYDIFMYTEDDVLISNTAFQYWLTYSDRLIQQNYNLGFIRIEFDLNNEEYMTDVIVKFSILVKIESDLFCKNEHNPYCAFWIYNKQEFNNFVNSRFYDPNNIPYYNCREKSAIGLGGISNYWYKGTLIPVQNNKLIDDCKVYHLTNNYVMNSSSNFCKIKFNDAIDSSCL